MRIDEQHFDEISVLSIAGELDARTLPDAAGAVDGLFKSLRTRIVFNLSGVPIVTSSTIAFLIDTAKRARHHNGDAVISEPSDLLRKSLKVLKLDEFFRIFETDDQAIAHFQDLALDDTVESLPPPPDDWREKLKFWRKQ